MAENTKFFNFDTTLIQLKEVFFREPVNGLAFVIIVLVALILLFSMTFGRDMSARMHSTVRVFLYLGVFCFVFASGSALIMNFFGAKYEVELLVSPNFATEGLPLPQVSGRSFKFEKETRILSVNRNGSVQIGFDETINAIKAIRLASSQKDQKIAALNKVVNQQIIEFSEVTTVAQDLAAKTEAGVQFDTQVYKSRLSNIQRNFDRLKITP